MAGQIPMNHDNIPNFSDEIAEKNNTGSRNEAENCDSRLHDTEVRILMFTLK